MLRFGSNGGRKTPYLLREVMPAGRSVNEVGSRVEAILATWFGWSDDSGGLPDWSVFKPFAHKHLLPHVAVCKHIDGDYRCVLMGDEVQNWMVRKVQGELIQDAFPVENAGDVVMRFDRALADKLPNYTEKTMAWNEGRDFVRYRNLHMPFSCARDGQDRILSVFEFEF